MEVVAQSELDETRRAELFGLAEQYRHCRKERLTPLQTLSEQVDPRRPPSLDQVPKLVNRYHRAVFRRDLKAPVLYRDLVANVRSQDLARTSLTLAFRRVVIQKALSFRVGNRAVIVAKMEKVARHQDSTPLAQMVPIVPNVPFTFSPAVKSFCGRCERQAPSQEANEDYQGSAGGVITVLKCATSAGERPEGLLQTTARISALRQ